MSETVSFNVTNMTPAQIESLGATPIYSGGRTFIPDSPPASHPTSKSVHIKDILVKESKKYNK